jgi:hypothetical protein
MLMATTNETFDVNKQLIAATKIHGDCLAKKKF